MGKVCSRKIPTKRRRTTKCIRVLHKGRVLEHKQRRTVGAKKTKNTGFTAVLVMKRQIDREDAEAAARRGSSLILPRSEETQRSAAQAQDAQLRSLSPISDYDPPNIGGGNSFGDYPSERRDDDNRLLNSSGGNTDPFDGAQTGPWNDSEGEIQDNRQGNPSDDSESESDHSDGSLSDEVQDDPRADNSDEPDSESESASESEPDQASEPTVNVKLTLMQKMRKRFSALVGSFKVRIARLVASCNNCGKVSDRAEIFKCGECAVNFCIECWPIAHQGLSQLHCASRVVDGRVVGKPTAPPVKPIFMDTVHPDNAWKCGLRYNEIELLTSSQGRIGIQVELCSNKNHWLEQLFQHGFIPCSSFLMEKVVSIELIEKFGAFFANAKCSGNDFHWSVKATSFLKNFKECDSKAIYDAHNIYMYYKWEEKKAIQGPFAEDWCPACPNKNTLNWPGNEGIIEFGAAVTLLERLLAVTDIEEKALMNEYDDVIDALCVADSFFHNCGTPIRLPFQMSFDGCLRIKHEKKEPSDESEAICAEPYSNQVPLSAITNNNSNSTCSKFLANYEYPQSKKNDRFDRRAVAGSVCSRHGVPIPKTFSNVYCGEAYAYCDSALKSVIDYFERNEIDIVLYYDIACQYQVNIKHLKRLPDLDRNRVKFAVPTFHLYAHKLDCHTNFASKAIKHTGNTVGEMTETLWSVIGGFSCTLRAMRLGRHVDYFNLILREYSKWTAGRLLHRTIKKIKNYPRSLSDAKTNLAQAAEALKESSPDLFQADISIADIERVVSDIKRKLGSKSNSTILMPYEEALVEYYCATDEAAEEKHLLKVEALESEIGLTVRIEKESELFSTIHKKFRTKQLELAAEKILSKRAGHKKLEDRKKKDEKGQKTSGKFDEAITKSKRELYQLIEAYNTLLGTAQSMGVFLEYERFSYAANLHEEVLKRHNGCGLSPEELNLLDKLNLYERVLEEKQFLLQEVRNIILYHRRRLDYAMGACDNRIPQNKLEPEQIKWLADSFRDLVVILKKSKPFLEAAMAPRPAREQSANNICEYL